MFVKFCKGWRGVMHKVLSVLLLINRVLFEVVEHLLVARVLVMRRAKVHIVRLLFLDELRLHLIKSS
jgi:hypothetical protein